MNISMSSSVSTTEGSSPTTSQTSTTNTTTAAATTTPTTTTTSMYASSPINTEAIDTMPIIVGSVCGSVVLLGIIVAVVIFFVLRRRRRQRATRPPILPDLKQTVVLESSQSTSNLVDNQCPSATVSLKPEPTEPESPKGGNSADGLPLAPPVPVTYEAPDLQDDLYVNRGAELDIQGDYVAPLPFQLPVTEDLYMPMAGSTNPQLKDLDYPIPSHELVGDYTLPSIPKPPVCKGSFGYINVPNSDSENANSGNVNANSGNVDTHSGKTYTLPKYANLAEGAEMDREEDYENVQNAKALVEARIPSKAKPATPSPIPQNAKASAHQMADILMKNFKTNGAPRLKSSPNRTKICTHTNQNSSSSSASSTPKSKKKIPFPPSSDSAEDYVNVKKLLKKNGKR